MQEEKPQNPEQKNIQQIIEEELRKHKIPQLYGKKIYHNLPAFQKLVEYEQDPITGQKSLEYSSKNKFNQNDSYTILESSDDIHKEIKNVMSQMPDPDQQENSQEQEGKKNDKHKESKFIQYLFKLVSSNEIIDSTFFKKFKKPRPQHQRQFWFDNLKFTKVMVKIFKGSEYQQHIVELDNTQHYFDDKDSKNPNLGIKEHKLQRNLEESQKKYQGYFLQNDPVEEIYKHKQSKQNNFNSFTNYQDDKLKKQSSGLSYNPTKQQRQSPALQIQNSFQTYNQQSYSRNRTIGKEQYSQYQQQQQYNGQFQQSKQNNFNSFTNYQDDELKKQSQDLSYNLTKQQRQSPALQIQHSYQTYNQQSYSRNRTIREEQYSQYQQQSQQNGQFLSEFNDEFDQNNQIDQDSQNQINPLDREFEELKIKCQQGTIQIKNSQYNQPSQEQYNQTGDNQEKYEAIISPPVKEIPMEMEDDKDSKKLYMGKEEDMVLEEDENDWNLVAQQLQMNKQHNNQQQIGIVPLEEDPIYMEDDKDSKKLVMVQEEFDWDQSVQKQNLQMNLQHHKYTPDILEKINNNNLARQN